MPSIKASATCGRGGGTLGVGILCTGLEDSENARGNKSNVKEEDAVNKSGKWIRVGKKLRERRNVTIPFSQSMHRGLPQGQSDGEAIMRENR